MVAADAFSIEKAGEIIDVGPGVAGGIGRECGVLFGDGVEVEGLELLVETLLIGFYRRDGGWES